MLTGQLFRSETIEVAHFYLVMADLLEAGWQFASLKVIVDARHPLTVSGSYNCLHDAMENIPLETNLRIDLFATEIANILDMNPFCTRTETLKRVWHRIEGDRVPVNFRPTPDHVKAIGRTKKGVQIRRNKYTIDDLNKFDSLVAELKKVLNEEGFSDMVDAAAQFVRCEMGRNSEVLAIDVAEANPSIGKCRAMQERYCKKVWTSPAGDAEIFVSGRIDCYDQQGRVVEIKTRVGRTTRIDPHEMIQLQTYLFLTGAPAGYVLELENRAKLTIGPLNTLDEKWWNDVVIPSLGAFGDDLVTSMKANDLLIVHDITFDDENGDDYLDRSKEDVSCDL